jgi:hypothetical protein
MKKSLFATAFLPLLVLLLFGCICQAQEFVPQSLPTHQELYGQNVRKVTERYSYKDGSSHKITYSYGKDGRMIDPYTSPFKYDKKTKEWVSNVKGWTWRVRIDTLSNTPIVVRTVEKKYMDNSVQIRVIVLHRNLQTMTDSLFSNVGRYKYETVPVADTLPLELSNIVYYYDSAFNSVRKDVKVERYKNKIQFSVDSFCHYTVGDTSVKVQLLDDTNLDCSNPQRIIISRNYSNGDTLVTLEEEMNYNNSKKTYSRFVELYKYYPNGASYGFFVRDTLNISTRYVLNDRKLIDTVYKYRRYGRPNGCFGLPKEERKEWREVETHQYVFDRKGALCEDRLYYNGELSCTTRYKVKYYRKKRKAKSK